jgi:hypothetical protein
MMPMYGEVQARVNQNKPTPINLRDTNQSARAEHGRQA